MKLFSPAKINLMLHVTGKRPDSYHMLQSLVSFADFGDRMVVRPASDYALKIAGPFADRVSADEDNLVTRAVRLMEKHAGRAANNLEITLTKNIPVGAGLGGGSSNAATIMHSLNKHWKKNFPLEELQTMGAGLGADVPVCLAGGMQWVEGIGEKLTPVLRPTMPAVLLWPGKGLSSTEVFKNFKPPFSDPLKEAPWNLAECRNDLTDAAAKLLPDVRDALAALQGADIIRMSGSGAAVFGLYNKMDAAKEAAALLAAEKPDWWVQACRINP